MLIALSGLRGGVMSDVWQEQKVKAHERWEFQLKYHAKRVFNESCMKALKASQNPYCIATWSNENSSAEYIKSLKADEVWVLFEYFQSAMPHTITKLFWDMMEDPDSDRISFCNDDDGFSTCLFKCMLSIHYLNCLEALICEMFAEATIVELKDEKA